MESGTQHRFGLQSWLCPLGKQAIGARFDVACMKLTETPLLLNTRLIGSDTPWTNGVTTKVLLVVVLEVSVWVVFFSLKFYDSLLETPRSRTSPTSGFRRGSVSRNSASTRWGQWWVSPKYSDLKCECCWIVLTYFWCLLPTRIRTFIRNLISVCYLDQRANTYFLTRVVKTQDILRKYFSVIDTFCVNLYQSCVS